ncbi:MAG: complex I NDUFA9 subunit family protein [Hyphomicrobiales bacterium]|nr:complex I NDUFA9 subunit family protein [Hyphomicrobiales bacterium]PCH50691.1 MAG: complex I NDUFA9 subunit family protein [Hyphomicrobiales bacterium]
MRTNSNAKIVTVFGGSGFVGRHVVRALAKNGYKIKVAVRRPDLTGHLQPLGDLGQIKAIQANVRYYQSVQSAVQGSDIVINLIGTFSVGGKNNCDAVNDFGARAIAQAAKDVKARFIHISSLSADIDSQANYSQSKAAGEEAVFEIIKSAIIMRPSVIFGQEDAFFNRFAAMSTVSPFLPLIGGGKTLFQPVYVGDVADAIVKAANGDLKTGRIYELGGARVASFRECMETMLETIDRKRTFIPLPWFVANTIAKLTGWLPGAPITSDQVKVLQSDNVVSQEAIKQKRTLEGMGIEPRPMESILPSYLVRFRPQGQFTRQGEM